MEVQTENAEPPPADPQPSGKIRKGFKLFGKKPGNIFSLRNKGDGNGKEKTPVVRSKTLDGLSESSEGEKEQTDEESLAEDGLMADAPPPPRTSISSATSAKSLSFLSLLRGGRRGAGDRQVHTVSQPVGRQRRGLKGLFGSVKMRSKDDKDEKEENPPSPLLRSSRSSSVEIIKEDLSLTPQCQPRSLGSPAGGSSETLKEDSATSEVDGIRTPEPPLEPGDTSLSSLLEDISSLLTFDSITAGGDIMADVEAEWGRASRALGAGLGEGSPSYRSIFSRPPALTSFSVSSPPASLTSASPVKLRTLASSNGEENWTSATPATTEVSSTPPLNSTTDRPDSVASTEDTVSPPAASPPVTTAKPTVPGGPVSTRTLEAELDPCESRYEPSSPVQKSPPASSSTPPSAAAPPSDPTSKPNLVSNHLDQNRPCPTVTGPDLCPPFTHNTPAKTKPTPGPGPIPCSGPPPGSTPPSCSGPPSGFRSPTGSGPPPPTTIRPPSAASSDKTPPAPVLMTSSSTPPALGQSAPSSVLRSEPKDSSDSSTSPTQLLVFEAKDSSSSVSSSSQPVPQKTPREPPPVLAPCTDPSPSSPPGLLEDPRIRPGAPTRDRPEDPETRTSLQGAPRDRRALQGRTSGLSKIPVVGGGRGAKIPVRENHHFDEDTRREPSTPVSEDERSLNPHDVRRSRDDVRRSRDDVRRSRDDVRRSRDDLTDAQTTVASTRLSQEENHAPPRTKAVSSQPRDSKIPVKHAAAPQPASHLPQAREPPRTKIPVSKVPVRRAGGGAGGGAGGVGGLQSRK